MREATRDYVYLAAPNLTMNQTMMQNPHARWRVEVAERLAQPLATLDGVQAIAIAGSVARNYADAYSDIEIPLFWDARPDDATRLAMVRLLKADFLHAYDGPSWEDQILVGGLQVDLWHVPVSEQEAIIDAVMLEHSSDIGHLHAVDTIRACIPLHGHALIHNWQERVQTYPDEVARKVIREHISSFRINELAILSWRDNPTGFYAQLCTLQQEMFLVLLALNRSYYPTFKWLYPMLDTFTVKPADISQRFRRAFEADYRVAIADTQALLEEVLQLVEGQFPDVDTAAVWRRLAYVRAKHTEPVTLYPFGEI